MKIDDNLNQILESHLLKPEKVEVYKNGVIKNNINDVVSFKATWSWWAFLTTWAFFLYRKMYLQAGIFFVLSVFSYMIPFGNFVIGIICGISAMYFYTKKLDNDLKIAGYENKPLEEVRTTLSMLGGYNSWVIWVAAIFYTLVFIWAFMFIAAAGVAGSSF